MSDAPPPYPQQPPPSQQFPPQAYPPQPPPAYPNTAAGYGAPPPGPPGSPGAAPTDTEIRPKARWFWIGGGIMVLGIAGAIAFGVLNFIGISNTVDDFARVTPGSDTIRIESEGEYVIYAEDGSFFASVEVVTPDGEPVATSRYLTGLEYDFNGRSGQAVYTFDADDTGRYTITTDSDIAIGESIADDLIRTILVPIVVGGVAFLTGLIVIIVTAVKRSGAKKRAAFAG